MIWGRLLQFGVEDVLEDNRYPMHQMTRRLEAIQDISKTIASHFRGWWLLQFGAHGPLEFGVGLCNSGWVAIGLES
jgi:hypothetical protein